MRKQFYRSHTLDLSDNHKARKFDKDLHMASFSFSPDRQKIRERERVKKEGKDSEYVFSAGFTVNNSSLLENNLVSPYPALIIIQHLSVSLLHPLIQT